MPEQTSGVKATVLGKAFGGEIVGMLGPFKAFEMPKMQPPPKIEIPELPDLPEKPRIKSPEISKNISKTQSKTEFPSLNNTILANQQNSNSRKFLF